MFFANTGDGLSILSSSDTVQVYNNIFRSNGGYGINTSTGTLGQFFYLDYNCSNNNTSGHIDINGGTLPGSNNVLTNPYFKVETDGSEDFRLQSTSTGDANDSPCLDVGIGYNG